MFDQSFGGSRAHVLVLWIAWSLERSLEQPVGRSRNHSLIDGSSARTPDRSMFQSLDSTVARMVDRWISRSLDRSIARSLGRTVTRLLACSIAGFGDCSIARSFEPSVPRSLDRLNARSNVNLKLLCRHIHVVQHEPNSTMKNKRVDVQQGVNEQTYNEK